MRTLQLQTRVQFTWDTDGFWPDATGEQKDFEVYSCHVSPDGSRLATAGGGMRAPNPSSLSPPSVRDRFLTLRRWPCTGLVHRVDLPVRRPLLLQTAPALPHEPPPRHDSLRALLPQRSLSRLGRRRQDHLHIPPRHQPSVTRGYVWYARPGTTRALGATSLADVLCA